MPGRPNKTWMRTMIERHGSREAVAEFMARQGAKGGSAPHAKPRGFAANPELASRVGKIGGANGRRGASLKRQYVKELLESGKTPVEIKEGWGYSWQTIASAKKEMQL